MNQANDTFNGLTIGDVVRLKSGGIPMTVSEYNSGNKKFLCTWNLNGEIKESYISPYALEKSK